MSVLKTLNEHLLQLNGKPLVASSRITTIYELGFAVLEINNVTVFDHGQYDLIAGLSCIILLSGSRLFYNSVNQLGEARQSAIVEVIGELHSVADITTHSYNVHITGTRSDSVYLEQTQHESSVPMRDQHAIVDRPNFHNEFRSQEVVERAPLHLESKLTPVHDGNMKVQFLHNDTPIQGGRSDRIIISFDIDEPIIVDDRVQLQYQAGFVVISISEVRAEDAGVWWV